MAISVTITPEAEQALSQLSAEPKADYVRVSAAQSCGCGNVGYRMFWDDAKNDQDVSLERGGLTLLIDRESQAHVEGCVIDYQSEDMREGFVITNPNATSGCGCGGH